MAASCARVPLQSIVLDGIMIARGVKPDTSYGDFIKGGFPKGADVIGWLNSGYFENGAFVIPDGKKIIQLVCKTF